MNIPQQVAKRGCFTQWMGAVAMEPRTLSSMWSMVEGLDIPAIVSAHAAKQVESKAMGGEAGRGYVMAGDVAVLAAFGPVSKEASSMGEVFGGTSTVALRQGLEQALADPAVKTILMHIDSPGGTVAGVGDLADDIFEARKKKRVVSYIEDLGASAAYWIASQAHHIYASRHAEVGSIGVFASLVDMSAKAEKEGIKVHLVSSGGIKGGHVPGLPISEAVLAEVQRGVDATNALFIEAIMRGRGLDEAKVTKVNTGSLFSAKEAKRLGLIDEVAPLRKVLAALQQPASSGAKRIVSSTATAIGTFEASFTSHLEALQQQFEDGAGVFAGSTPVVPPPVDEDDEEEGEDDIEMLVDPKGNPAAAEVQVPVEAATGSHVASLNTESPLLAIVGSQEPTPEVVHLNKETPPTPPASGATVSEPGTQAANVPSVNLEAKFADMQRQLDAIKADKASEAKSRLDAKRIDIANRYSRKAEELAVFETEASLDRAAEFLAASRGAVVSLGDRRASAPADTFAVDMEKERQVWAQNMQKVGMVRA